MNRRGVLSCVGLMLQTGLGGCLTGTAIDSDRSPSSSASPAGRPSSVRTPPKGDCEPSPRPTPDSPRTKRYPAHPDSLTVSTARRFASAFERAYQYNSRLPEYETVAVSASVPDRTVSETRQGYTLGVEGRVSFDDAGSTATSSATTHSVTSTPLPSGTTDFSVWYYLTDRFALRGDPVDELRKGDTPDLTGADTVSCDGR